MKIKEFYDYGLGKLKQHSIENPELNIGYLLEEVTGFKRLSLPLHYQADLSTAQSDRLHKMLDRRCKHEPLQYILAYTEFYGHRLNVSPHVLIPRPETEYLIDLISKSPCPKKILDIGTGSGAIAISLKKIFPSAQVVAVDISAPALHIAQENARINQADIKFVQTNIYQKDLGKFDLLVSNPPYVTETEYQVLPREVQTFEPKLALLGKDNGLFFYQEILKLAPNILSNNGCIYFEIGENQAQDIKKIALSYGFQQIDVIQDLTMRDRIMRIQ